MNRLLPLSSLIVLHLMAAGELPYGPIRAAYEFSYGDAYSAVVQLPAYRIVDLGTGAHPVDITDSMEMLLRTDDGRLIHWAGGQRNIISDNFSLADWASMNEGGSILTTYHLSWSDHEMRYWLPGDETHCLVEGGTCLPSPPGFSWPYALNDEDQLVMNQDCEIGSFLSPPHTFMTQTNLYDLRSGTCAELASYSYHLDENHDLAQGGILYTVNGLNNYGETVGEVYTDSAFTDNSGITYTHQDQYFALNRNSVLEFEPFRINDWGTVLGRTLGPQYSLVVLDQFGQRAIGPVIHDLESVRPCMSNPLDGLEELVVDKYYFKRMSECDFAGRPTGQPSPDFHESILEDLVTDKGSWGHMEASCISANGRIAGIGRYFNFRTFRWEDRGFLLIPQLLIPDWDRNGRIDREDRLQAAKPFPWFFWVNDDDDSGDLARSWEDDLPGSDNPDWEEPGVDGLRDVVDFFPLLIDIRKFLEAVDDITLVEVRLSQADEALNFIYTDLSPDAFEMIHDSRPDTGFGPLFSEMLESAQTHPVTADPVYLSQDFLRGILEYGNGILLMEGKRSTSQPLVMEYRYNGESVFRCELPLSIGPVDDMFRILNLRNADTKFSDASPGPWLTRLDDPPNLPDAFLRSFAPALPTLVHIHGFNWGGNQVPAAHAELFKRFYQTGSQARFIGATWFGDEGTLELLDTSFDYNENVINAFISAGYLKDSLAPLSAPLTSVFAHSLGNMVASSAIIDHGWNVTNYFMVNAAVPTEAYLGEQNDRRKMVNPEWKDEGPDNADYPEFLLPSKWSELFGENDRRSALCWKNRFADISANTICYNFYSTGEDILRSGNGDLPALLGDIRKTELIWVYNEMVKGTGTLASNFTGDIHGGWGFNYHHMDWINPGGGAHPPAGEWVRMLPGEAAGIEPQLLVSEPFFKPFSDGDPDFPDWNDGAWLYGDMDDANAHLPPDSFAGVSLGLVKNHAKILAEALPAHSNPTGSNTLPKLPLLLNYDLDTVVRKALFWPFRSPAEKKDRWLHSDYLNPALPFVADLYRICIESINN